MEPNTDDDRKSTNGIRRGMSCGMPIPVVDQALDFSLEIDPEFIVRIRKMKEDALTAKIKNCDQIQKHLDDRRWATDPLELMDKLEDFVTAIAKFLAALSA